MATASSRAESLGDGERSEDEDTWAPQGQTGLSAQRSASQGRRIERRSTEGDDGCARMKLAFNGAL